MQAFIPIISLLVVLTLGLLVTRIATVALTFTGLSHELAWFQAHSAYMGVGFTTTESERVLEHPVRRRIIIWLMLAGNAGLIASVSSVIPVFFAAAQGGNLLPRIVLLICGLILLWALANSKWIDGRLSKMIAWALKHWTHMDISDYPALLQLSSGYTVTEMPVEPGDWVAGKSLITLRLSDEGVQVLGIRRAEGDYLGAPTGRTYIRRGDMLVVYGRIEHIAELSRRRADRSGDIEHVHRVEAQHRVVEELVLKDDRGAHHTAEPQPNPTSEFAPQPTSEPQPSVAGERRD